MPAPAGLHELDLLLLPRTACCLWTDGVTHTTIGQVLDRFMGVPLQGIQGAPGGAPRGRSQVGTVPGALSDPGVSLVRHEHAAIHGVERRDHVSGRPEALKGGRLEARLWQWPCRG